MKYKENCKNLNINKMTYLIWDFREFLKIFCKVIISSDLGVIYNPLKKTPPKLRIKADTEFLSVSSSLESRTFSVCCSSKPLFLLSSVSPPVRMTSAAAGTSCSLDQCSSRSPCSCPDPGMSPNTTKCQHMNVVK